MEFLSEHIGLKDPEILFNSVVRTALRLQDDGIFENLQDAVYSAAILVAFPFEGKEELSEEQLLKTAAQIINDCQEYAKMLEENNMNQNSYQILKPIQLEPGKQVVGHEHSTVEEYDAKIERLKKRIIELETERQNNGRSKCRTKRRN